MERKKHKRCHETQIISIEAKQAVKRSIKVQKQRLWKQIPPPPCRTEVREDHTDPKPSDVKNTICSVSLDGSGDMEVLVEGSWTRIASEP